MKFTVSTDLLEELQHLADVANDSREDSELESHEEAALDFMIGVLKTNTFEIPDDAEDALHWFDQFLEQIEDRLVSEPGAKKLVAEIRGVLIQLGVYREVSEEELSRTMVSHGKKYSFKLDGKKYKFEKHL